MTDQRGVPAAGSGILLSVAPCLAVAVDLPVLLRIAVDAEQVGAGRLHLPAGLPDPARTAAELRSQTRLVLTADTGDPAVACCDAPGPAFTEIVLDPGPPADLVATVAGIARDAATSGNPTSVGGRGAADITALLAAIAAGLHVRVGTADTGLRVPAGSASIREDLGLIGRAAGIARIAGRPLLRPDAAAAVLGVRDPSIADSRDQSSAEGTSG